MVKTLSIILLHQACGGHRKPLKTADSCRKPKFVVENRRKPQICVRHLRSITLSAGFRKRGRRNGVASDFFRFLPFFSVFFPFFFRFFPFPVFSFLAVFFGFRFFPFFFPFSFVFFRFPPFPFQKKKGGDTIRETPFAKPRLSAALIAKFGALRLELIGKSPQSF